MSSTNALEILDAIRPLVARSGIADVNGSTPLLSSGVIDSLGIAELGDLLNATFGIEISIDQLGFDNADTAEQLAEIVTEARSRS